MLTITLDSAIRFRFDPTTMSELGARLKKDTTMDNPQYQKLIRMGKRGWGVPAVLRFYDWDPATQELTLPRGYLGRLLAHLAELHIAYEVRDHRIVMPKVAFLSQIVLRGYQVKAVNSLLAHDQGIIEAPCGSGKTQMMLEVIARRGQPALWLTHTKALAKQTMDRAVLIGLDPKEIGMIGDGRRKIGERLTIGLIQTMARMTPEDLREIAGEFGVVVIDECHLTPAATWSRVIRNFPARYRYGGTATLTRGDGLQVATRLYIGPTRCEIPLCEVIDEGGGVIPRLVVVRYQGASKVAQAHMVDREKYDQAMVVYREALERYKLDINAGRRARKPVEPRRPIIDYGRLAPELLDNPDRNALIVDTIGANARGHVSLVLSERVEHCRQLESMLVKRCPDLRTAIVDGNTPGKQREAVFDQARRAELDVLFSVQIARVGLDIPRIDRLHILCGGKALGDLQQKIGRMMRPAEGKTDAVVFDYLDEQVETMVRQYWQRRRVYRELGMLDAGGRQRRTG